MIRFVFHVSKEPSRFYFPFLPQQIDLGALRLGREWIGYRGARQQ